MDEYPIRTHAQLDSTDAKKIALILRKALGPVEDAWLEDLCNVFERLANTERPRLYGIVRIKAQEEQ